MSLKKDNNILGIILAAGESRRLNSPKQLLKWGDDYLINHIVRVVSFSAAGKIRVVLGSHAHEISSHIINKNVNIVINKDWENGMSSSLKAGIASLEEDIEGAFILLVDQPFITTELLDRMIETFQQTSALIIAPRVGKQQCNPVLFKRQLFPELKEISGDRGAKALLSRHPVEWVDWQDERLLLDIDSEEDYQHVLRQAW